MTHADDNDRRPDSPETPAPPAGPGPQAPYVLPPSPSDSQVLDYDEMQGADGARLRPSEAAIPTRGETRRAARDHVSGRPIRVGILGTSGAGKTTYQTALAYTLVRGGRDDGTTFSGDGNGDDATVLHGQPVGVETRQFLSHRVQELIAGRFPLPTNDATELLYKVEGPRQAMLLCMMDYRGGDLPELYASGHRPETLPGDLQQLAEYFLDCDGYIFLVNSRVLLSDQDETQFQRFWNEFLVYKDVLQYLIEQKPREAGRLREPFALVATQTDIVPADPASQRRLEDALDSLRGQLKRHARYIETFRTSAIGPEFLGDDGAKLPHARLAPQNVVAPVRWILNAQDRHARLRRRILATTVTLVLLFGVLLGGAAAWIDADAHIEAAKSLAAEPGLTEAEIGQRLNQLGEIQANTGLAASLIPRDVDGVFRETRQSLLAAMDQRRFEALKRDAGIRPVERGDLIAYREALAEYESATAPDGTPLPRAYVEPLQRAYDEMLHAYDERVWRIALRSETIDGYRDYIEAVADLPASSHMGEARRRIETTRFQGIQDEWESITRYAQQHPSDHETIVADLDAFLDRHESADLERLSPDPRELFRARLDEWDTARWRDAEVFYQEQCDVNGGTIEGSLVPAIELYEAYLSRLRPYRTPQMATAAQARINSLTERMQPRLYRIRLKHGDFDGYVEDEPNPDIYVRIYVNNQEVFRTDEHDQTDTANPNWNRAFHITWKAYDSIRIEVRDEDHFPDADDEVYRITDSSVDAVETLFDGGIEATNGSGSFRLVFEIEN